MCTIADLLRQIAGTGVNVSFLRHTLQLRQIQRTLGFRFAARVQRHGAVVDFEWCGRRRGFLYTMVQAMFSEIYFIHKIGRAVLTLNHARV